MKPTENQQNKQPGQPGYKPMNQPGNMGRDQDRTTRPGERNQSQDERRKTGSSRDSRS